MKIIKYLIISIFFSGCFLKMDTCNERLESIRKEDYRIKVSKAYFANHAEIFHGKDKHGKEVELYYYFLPRILFYVSIGDSLIKIKNSEYFISVHKDTSFLLKWTCEDVDLIKKEKNISLFTPHKSFYILDTVPLLK